MTSIGHEGLVNRMKKIISAVMPTRVVDNIDLKENLLKNNNYTVTFEQGKLTSITMSYYEYDGITVKLNCLGMNAYFEPEHGDPEDLLKIDGFEEFINLTN